MKKEFESKEIMIARNGKPTFAVCISSEGNDANYVFVEGGDIKFSSSWLSSIQPFALSNESHRIAKEIFTAGLQTAIKVKILELKQLESIFHDINLSDCLGSILVDNTRLLLEVKDSIEKTKTDVIDCTGQEIKKLNQKIDDNRLCTDEVKHVVEQAIVETVKPIAVKKSKKLQ